jgi:LysM repeat protein
VSSFDWPGELRRYAVPVLLLVCVTVAALVVRGSLREDDPRSETKPRAVQPAAPRVQVQRAAAKFHVVAYGDTLGEIADRYETSVERLVELNPGVDPAALRVGQRVRVG